MRRNTPRAQRERQRRLARQRRRRTFRLEQLEERALLALTIPNLMDVSVAEQLLLAPEQTTLGLAAADAANPYQQLYRVAVDHDAGPATYSFELQSLTQADAAVALYDADGNLIQVADSDPDPLNPGDETLSVDLHPNRQYVLAVLGDANKPPSNFRFLATAAPQRLNSAVALDPGTGVASFQAIGDTDLLGPQADVNYFPLVLTNAAESAVVEVTPTSLDVIPAATVYMRMGPQSSWRPVVSETAAGPGQTATLVVNAVAGRNLTDAQYMLVVGPADFDTAGGSLQIDVTAPVLGPATVNPPAQTIVTPPAVDVDLIRLTHNSNGPLPIGGSELIGFRAAADGNATIQITPVSPGIDPLVSVYDASGANLLAVHSRTNSVPFNFTMPVTAGTAYLLRVADVDGDDGGEFTLQAHLSYQATEVQLDQAITDLGVISLAAATAPEAFRIHVPPGTDAISIELVPTDPAAPDPVAPMVTLLSSELPPLTNAAAAGQPVKLHVDISQLNGPFDLLLAGQQGSGPVSVRVGYLSVPLELDLDALPGAAIDLAGDLPPTQATGGFGSLLGVAFYQHVTEEQQDPVALLEASGASALPLIAVYEEVGGKLRRVGIQFPDASGLAGLNQELSVNRYHALAVIPMGLAGGPVSFHVNGPQQTGVGVGMAPDPPPVFPCAPFDGVTCKYDPEEPSPPLVSELNIRNVVLEAEFQQHLWRTLLPLNMREDVANPLVVTITPKSGLGATVEVIRPDGTPDGDVLATFTTVGGLPASIQIQNPHVSQLQGEPLLFRVTPLADQLDDGIYTLKLSVKTHDPHPFEVIENYWRKANNLFWRLDDPFSVPFSGINDPPTNLAFVGNSQEIVLNQLGDGSAIRTFTSSDPFTLGSVHIYRFKASGDGPLTVSTVGMDPKVNTNLRVYRAQHINGPEPNSGSDFLVPLEQPVVNGSPTQVLPNFDWFPANRTTIDAQTFLRHQDPFGLAPEEWYYVVVKNQEASLGQYEIKIDAPHSPLANFARLPVAAPGTRTANITDLNADPKAIRYVEVQMPDYHDGTLAVNTTPGQGLWDLDVFNAAGESLAGNVTDGNSFSGGTFSIQPGPQAVYVRVMERSGNTNNTATIAIGAGVSLPAGTAAPAQQLGLVPLDPIVVNPFADGSMTGDVSPAAPVERLVMQATSGPLNIVVQPSGPNPVPLRWGVYVNGQLAAWDQTRIDADGNPIGDSLWTQIVLPDLATEGFARLADCFESQALQTIVPCADPDDIRPAEFQPSAEVDYAFDRSAYHSVVITVQAVDSAATGSFQFDVESGTDKPLRTRELTIDPRNGQKSLLTERGAVTTENSVNAPPINPMIVTGMDWIRLAVPSDTIGNVELEVTRPEGGLGPANVPVHYRVYSPEGALLTSGTESIQAPSLKAVISLPAQVVTGGSAYYLQVYRATDPTKQLGLKAKADFAGKNGPKPPPELLVPSSGIPNGLFFDPNGHAQRTFPVDPGDTEMAFTPIWVSAPGQVSIRAQLTNGGGPALALYRARLVHIGGEFDPSHVDLVLLDYTNQATQGKYQLSAHLDPGLYAVRVTRTTNAAVGSVNLEVDMPEQYVEDIVLDPNFGRNDLPGLKLRDTAASALAQGVHAVNGSNLVESYRRTLMRVVAPAGSLGSLTARAEATHVGTTTSANIDEDLRALFNVWQLQGNGFVIHLNPDPFINPSITQIVPDLKLAGHDAEIGPTQKAIPGEDLYLVLNRQGLANTIEVTASIPVPFSGTPDLVVLPIGLTPNHGETTVTVQVTNAGYAPADPSTGLFSLRDASKPAGLQWSTSSQLIPTLGPFGSTVRVLPWDPVTKDDQVKFEADPEVNLNDQIIGEIEELDEENNLQMRTIKEVDPNPPKVLSFQLADPTFDGTGPNDIIWGRYVADVSGTHAKYKVQVTDPDGDHTLYQTLVVHPDGSGTFPGEFTVPLGPETINENGVDFWKLEPTSGQFPNQFVAYAVDQWGLESDRVVRIAHVVERPEWPTSVLFDVPDRQYVMEFDRVVVDYQKTTNQLLNTSGIPFVGDKKNSLLLKVQGETTAPLNPLIPVEMGLTTHAKLKVLGETVFDQVFHPALPVTNQFSLQTNIDISSLTLDANNFTVGLKIVDLPVLSLASPEIPLFTFGIPGLAEITANLVVGVLADLNAGLTVAFDPVQSTALGLARPTFLGMDITPFISIIGEVEVLGFLDIASLEVTVGLDIGVDVGLKAPLMPNNPVPFHQLGSNIGVELSGGLTISAAADILGWEVWSDSWSFPFGSIGDDVITWDEVDPLINPLPPQQPNQPQGPGPQSNGPNPPPVINPPKTGSSLLGPNKILPYPQLVIDGPGGDALYVQVADPGNAKGNLYFSRRNSGAWSSLTQLSQSENVSNPALSLTNSSLDPTAVVVYQATALNDLTTATFDQYLNAQEIRWRYYDGTNWGNEQVLEANGQFDGNPAVAFNSSGQGAVAWAHNTGSQPLNSPGSNELMVSLWDPANLNWLPPVQLTSDVGASDARPAVHVAEDGLVTVVWLRNPDTSTTNSAVGKEVWFSQYSNGVWSPAALLPTLGLPDLSASGRITQVAIGSSGSDQAGNERLDVLIAYTRSMGEFEAESKLVHRAAWDHQFGSPAAVQRVSEKANYSELRTLRNPDGGLLAYWQQGTGGQNDVFAAQLAAPGPKGATWSDPTQLTFSPIQELAPTVAFDTNANNEPVLQLLYQQKQALDRPPVPLPPSSSDGIPMQSNVNAGRLRMLPELGFSRPLTFPGVTMAPARSESPGSATVVNRGLAGTEVEVKFQRTVSSQTTLLDTKTIYLGPGNSYELDYPFPVQPGNQKFSIAVTALDHGGQEMNSVQDNVTEAKLLGATEMVLESFRVVGPPPISGQQVKLVATVSNISDIDITAPFDVVLWLGDPSAPLGSGAKLDAKLLPKLSARSSEDVEFFWTVPAEGGSFVLTAMADNGHVITEAIEFNNAKRLNLQVLGDARVDDMQLALLNYSGVDNVLVGATIFNDGDADLKDVVVQLSWSRNNEPFQMVEKKTIPLLAKSPKGFQVVFTADGWAGNNTYRVSVVDPAVDVDPTNNSALVNIYLNGFADLLVGNLTPSTPTPSHGDPLRLKVQVDNAGIDDAEDVRVEVFAHSPLFGRRLVGRTFVEHLTPLSTEDVHVDVDTSQLVGVVKLEVHLDRLENILEITDHNNTAAITLDFPSDCELIRQGSRLHIRGTEADDQIQIEEDDNSLRVTCGLRPAVQLFGIQSVDVQTYGGRDLVDASLRRLVSFDAATGAGDDRLNFYHSGQGPSSANANLDTGPDADYVDIVLPSAATASNLAVVAHLGDGWNVADVRSSDAETLIPRDGDGETGLPRRGGASQSVQVTGGPQDDVLRFDYQSVLHADLSVDLNGMAGQDLIDAFANVGEGNSERLQLQAAGGDGDDDLRVTVLGDPSRVRQAGNLILDGGLGLDSWSAGENVQVVQAEQQIVSLIVNTDDDLDDGTCNPAHCSLREAINTANALPLPNLIRFRIPGAGPHTIQPTSALPTVTDPVFIDGLSEPGSLPNTQPIEWGTNAQIMVEVNGGLITDGSSGFVVTAGDSRLRSLAVTGFGYPDLGAPGSPENVAVGGIVLLGPGHNIVEGSFVGVDPVSGQAEPNNFYGIFISSSHNQVGGPHPWNRNLISGNQGFGIQLTGRSLPGRPDFTATEFNRIQGNLIGTDRSGTSSLPNTGAGIMVRLHARDTLIGGDHGPSNPVRNVISGNGGAFAPFGDPQGPYQGWPDTPYATSAGNGIHIENLTTFTPDYPVPNVIQGNYIGTNAQGTAAVPNRLGGISTGFTNHVTIGGSSNALSSGLCVGVCNLISGNEQWGVSIANFLNKTSGAVVQGNFIGSDRTGTFPIGNQDDGVLMIHAQGVLIGGTSPDLGNLIAHNGRNGILHRGHPAWTNPGGNVFRHNSIHSNALLGIDLVSNHTFSDGPTANDPGDVDDGPNSLQNFPEILIAQFGAQTFVSGNLSSLPNTSFQLEFFASAHADASGHGEGQQYLGMVGVTTDSSGNAVFSHFLPTSTMASQWITATATRMNLTQSVETSEFSAAVQLLTGVSVEDCTLRIHGTAGDDQVNVRISGQQYQVHASFLPTGAPVLVFDAAQVRHLEILTRDGADTIVGDLDYQPVFGPCHSRSKDSAVAVMMDTGPGDDSTQLLVNSRDHAFDWQLDVLPGLGQNQVVVDLVHQNERRATAHVDWDDQNLDEAVGGWLSLGLHAGADFRLVMDLNGESGNDTVNAFADLSFHSQPEPPLANVDAQMSIRGGQGDDQITAELQVQTDSQDIGYAPNIHAAVDVQGDEGHDDLNGTVLVNILPQPEPPTPDALAAIDTKLIIDGDAGNDIIQATVQIGVDETPVLPGSVIPNMTTELLIDGGAGDDAVQINAGGPMLGRRGVFKTVANTGVGDDQLAFSATQLNVAGDADVALSTGEGNDRANVSLRGSVLAGGQLNVITDLGSGDDALTFVDPLDISGDVAVKSHLGDGADSARMIVWGTNVAADGNLLLETDTGAGNDHLMLIVYRLDIAGDASLVSRTGDGDDNVSILTYSTRVEPEGSLAVHTDTGAGNDNLTVFANNLTLDGRAAFFAELGTDNDSANILLRRSAIGSTGRLAINVDAGKGDDDFRSSVDDLSLQGQLEMLYAGGEGDDRLRSTVRLERRSRGSLNARVEGGDGDDLLGLHLYDVSELAQLLAVADGGDGIDTCSATRNVRKINCER